MAIIPTVQGPTIQAQAEPLVFEAPSATAAAFGGRQAQQGAAQANALLQFAAITSDFARASQANRDKSIVRDQLNQAKSAARQFVADTRTKKGKAAINAYSETEQRLQELRKEHISRLTTEEQRQLFTSAYDPVMNAHLNRTLTFQQQSRSDYEKMTWAAENLNAVEDAILNSSDDTEIESSEATIIANTRAASKGAGKEISDKAVEGAIHTLHKSVIDSMKDADPAGALAYFEKHSDKIDPLIRGKLAKDLENRNEEVLIRDTALELSNSGLSLEDQLAEVDKIEDPSVAKGVRAAVGFRAREKKAIAKAKETKYSESQWDELFKDPLAFNIPLDLSATDQKGMLAFKNQTLKANQAVTDWNVFNELMGLSPSKFQDVDLTKHLSSLAPSEFKQLVGLQRSSRAKDKDDAFRVRTQYQQAQQAIKGIEDFRTTGRGRQKGARKERAAQRSNRFFEQFSAGLSLIPKEDQTEEKVGELITRILAPVDYDPSWAWGDQIKYRFEVPYLDEENQQEALEEFIPENLKKFKDVNYDRESQRYFIDGDGVRNIYDKYGTYQKTYRLIPTTKTSATPL